MRTVQFKALKEEEKIGFGLGGKDQRTEVVCVRKNTQAYWKGILVGYKVVKVNGKDISKITVTPAIKEVCTKSKNFSITFQVPGKPDWGDAENPEDGADMASPGGADDSTPADQAKPEKPIVEDGAAEAKDDNGAFAADEMAPLSKDKRNKSKRMIRSGSETLAAATITQATEQPPEQPKVIDLNTATKAELEALQKQKEEEIATLEKSQKDLAALIKEKEEQLKQNHERSVLEELKRLRKQARDLREALRRALEELDKIRAMLQKRIAELQQGVNNLATQNAARQDKLAELEATVRDLQQSARS